MSAPSTASSALPPVGALHAVNGQRLFVLREGAGGPPVLRKT